MTNRKEGVKIQSTLFCEPLSTLPQVTIKRHFATFSKPINSSVSWTTRRPSSSNKSSTNGSSINVPLIINEETTTREVNKSFQTSIEAKTSRKEASARNVTRKKPDRTSKAGTRSLQPTISKQAENKKLKPTTPVSQKDNNETAAQGKFILDTVGHQLAFIENSSSKPHREKHHKTDATKKFGRPTRVDESQKFSVKIKKVPQKDPTKDRTHFQQCEPERVLKPYNPSDYTEKEPSVQRVTHSNPLQSLIGLSDDMFQSTSTLYLLSSQTSNDHLVYKNIQNEAVDDDRWNRFLMTLENLPKRTQSDVDPETKKHSVEEHIGPKLDMKTLGENSLKTVEAPVIREAPKAEVKLGGLRNEKEKTFIKDDSRKHKERVDETKLHTETSEFIINGNKPSSVKPTKKSELIVSSMEYNTVSRNKDLYPIDNYLVPAVIGNSNYLQLSDFRESVEHLVVPLSGTSRMSEPKNENYNFKHLQKSTDLHQAKFSITANDSPTTPDKSKSTGRESKMEEIDRAMQAIRKQIMQSEMDILKIQAESIIKVDSELSGNNNTGEIQKVQKDATSRNDRNLMAHHETTYDPVIKSVAHQSLLNTSEKTCLCCSKPMNFPSNHTNSGIKKRLIDNDEQQFEKGNSYYSHKQYPMKNYQQFCRDSNECEKTSKSIRQLNSDNFNRCLAEVRNDNREYVEKFVPPQVSKNDCRFGNKFLGQNYSEPNNSFESHNSGARNVIKLNFTTLEGFDRSPEEFIENEVPQLIIDTRSQSRYGSSARLDNSCEIEHNEETCSRMGSAGKKQNVGMHCTFKPNAAVHRVVSQEPSTNAQSQSEIYHPSNSKLIRLKKALLPGVDIRSELIVQSGPTIHIPAVSKFSITSEKNKNVLLKEVVHVETEREMIISPPGKDSVDNNMKNNVVVEKKYDGEASCVKRSEKTFKRGGELLHPQSSKSLDTKVVDKQMDEGLSNNEIQEHLYNAVRTYANKLNSQNNTKIQKKLKETLQELSFNISRLYNNQMNEYVQCGRSRDVQAPLSYRMKAVAELLWEELELRTYPSENHYSQIEEIIHHLVNDLEDAIKDDIPLKTTVKEDISLKTTQPKTQADIRNSPLRNNRPDCRRVSTQSKSGGKIVKNAAENTFATKFSCSSTSGLGRSYATERNKKLEKRFGKFSTVQSRPYSKSNTMKIIGTTENNLPKGKKTFSEIERSRYFNEFVQGRRTVSNKCQKEPENSSSRGVQLEEISAEKPCSLSRDPPGIKQVLSEKSQICDSPSIKNSVFPEYSTEKADGFSQIIRPQSQCDDEDLMRFKRINTLYKLNKKLHSPNKTIAEIFGAESVTNAQCSGEAIEKGSNSLLDIERKCSTECVESLPKGREETASLEIEETEDNQPFILDSEKSVDQCDGKILDSNSIAIESLLTDNVTVLQYTVEETIPYPMAQNDSEEIGISGIIRLETVDEETEPSISHQAETDCDKTSRKSDKSEKEPDDESYEDDWEIDQDETSIKKGKDAAVHKQDPYLESKEVESHHAIEDLLSSSSTSLSAVSEIKNDDNEFQDSSGGGTYVKEKSSSNESENKIDHGEHLKLTGNTLDGLKLSLPSNGDFDTKPNQETTKNVLMNEIGDKQDSIDEEVVGSDRSKTFNVIKDAEVDKNNTVTISSSVSSEILQNDGKFDLNSEDFATAKNTNDNNYLIPLSARSNTTAEIRDSVGVKAVNGLSARKLNSCEIMNDNKMRCDKHCTNNTMPSTSLHLSIPETMDHLQNKITMTSNFENQEFKVTLELNKNSVSALSSPQFSNDLDNRGKSGTSTNSRRFERKISKAVNTETIVENDETSNKRSKGLNDGNLSEARQDVQGVSKVVDQESAQGGAQGLPQIVVQKVDWETKSHDLAQLRNRIEDLESTLSSTVGAVLEKLSNDLAKGPPTSGKHVGVSCKLDDLRTSHCQTDFELLKPIDSTVQCPSTENQSIQKTSLIDEINKVLHINREGAEKNYKQSVDTTRTNKHFLQRKYGTQSSTSQSSSSLVSIPRLSGSEEKSQSELSEGEVGMEAVICSCSFGEIKMSGCLRCGPYGVKKLTMKRSYPNLQKSDGEMSVKHVQRSSSEYSGSQSVDSCTKIRLDMKRDSRTVFKFKSKSLSQSKVSASKSFTNVVENIMDELKREKMEARMKFKRSQENFDAKFLKHSESLRRSASEISLKMSSSVVSHATMSSSQNYSSKSVALQNYYSTVSEGNNDLENPQPLPKNPQNNKKNCMEVISDESGDSEVAIEKLQELDSSSLFRLIRKRKDRQALAKLDQCTESPDKSDKNLSNNDCRGKSKLDFDGSTGKSNAQTVIDNTGLEESVPSNRMQSIEEVLKTFFSSTVSSEQEFERTQLLRQHKFPEGESSLVRTRKDLLDSDSCNSTIVSNTSDDRDRSEGQI